MNLWTIYHLHNKSGKVKEDFFIVRFVLNMLWWQIFWLVPPQDSITCELKSLIICQIYSIQAEYATLLRMTVA